MSETTEFVHRFTVSKAVLECKSIALRTAIKPNAADWVLWPRKASKVPTDITEDTMRELASSLGFVDIKVCVVSENGSGLTLVIRKELR